MWLSKSLINCVSYRLCDLIYQMFGAETPAADWDIECKYKPENLTVYFEDRRADALYELSPEAPIQAILSHKK